MSSVVGEAAPLLPGEWTVDALHSQVWVAVRHMAVASLRAKFPKISGSLQVDGERPLASRCRLEIDATAVTTGHPDQEDFIRSEGWLDTANHPLILFESDAIRQTAEKEYVVMGDLTLRGVTRPVEVPFRFHGVVSDRWGLRSGFTAQLELERAEFGLTWNRVFEWGVMAGPTLGISLDIELQRRDESLATQPLS